MLCFKIGMPGRPGTDRKLTNPWGDMACPLGRHIHKVSSTLDHPNCRAPFRVFRDLEIYIDSVLHVMCNSKTVDILGSCILYIICV